MTASVHIIGIRHHSPACARLVAHKLAQLQPDHVLIEGPSDYNERLPELLLAHELPIAIYSFIESDQGMAQSWFPFLDYSPEWVALKQGHAQGAVVRFIDLPHAYYRTRTNDSKLTVSELDKPARYRQLVGQLCARMQCDGEDALWDHLFEAAPFAELETRLEHYFAMLRGDTEAEDAREAAREMLMARHIAWAAQQGQRILVVCGGWHQPALAKLWPSLLQECKELPLATLDWDEPYHSAAYEDAESDIDEPLLDELVIDQLVPATKKLGSYLIPYEFRLVEALAGYQSGMQSPLFYQWCWQHGNAQAIEQALKAILLVIREKKVPASTAELLSLRMILQQLAALRGHAVATRVDLLDAVQSSLVKEALEAPAPWTARAELDQFAHPILREALLALTGEQIGRLHADTPAPPLLKDVEQLLNALDLQPSSSSKALSLDRRVAVDQQRSVLLWRLHLLGSTSVRLQQITAPKAARTLPESLRFKEDWLLQKNHRWYPELIEAAAYGASLQMAALAKIRESLFGKPAQQAGSISIKQLAQSVVLAVRAGYGRYGAQIAAQFKPMVAKAHDHGELADAISTLQDLQELGFWGDDVSKLVLPPLAQLLARLLWLLDGLQNCPAQLNADVAAVQCLLRALRLAPAQVAEGEATTDQNLAQAYAQAAPDQASVSACLVRLANSNYTPISLRGAAVGAAYQLQGISAQSVVEICRSIPPRDQLGDYLFGFFALAREALGSDPQLAAALHQAIESMSSADFLVALPQLRGAFAWFPPRERARIGAMIGKLLGLDTGELPSLLRLPHGESAFLDAKQVQAQVRHWLQEFGFDHD